MLDKFESAALEAIEKAAQEITDNGRLETRILNAEYYMGKFHAFMEIIEGMNTDRLATIVDRTREDISNVMIFIDQIYSIRVNGR